MRAMQRSHLIALAMALQAATAFAPSERTWAADAVPARTPRGKVRIEGLVLPDFPEDLVKPGAFERSIRDAVLPWHADPDDPYVKAGKAFDSCFKAKFSLN
jgi:hypothetical protein